MWHCLCSVDQHGHSLRVGVCHHLLDGVDGAEHIADVAEGHHARALAEHIAVAVHVERSVGRHGHHFQFDTCARAEQLPRHYVGMVFHDGEDDLVAMLEVAAETGCHKVDCFGGAAGKDHFGHGRGIDVGPDSFAGGFLKSRGLLREGVHAAVHVGFVFIVAAGDGFDHLPGSLGGGCIVEVYHIAAEQFLGQAREIGANLIDVKHCVSRSFCPMWRRRRLSSTLRSRRIWRRQCR